VKHLPGLPETELTYTASGVYDHIVSNANGCNDTLRLNLTINNGSLTEVSETTCETFTWTAGNGTTYTASGVYEHIVANTEGCNDTLRLNLTINNGSLTEVSETTCETFTWTAGNGTTYTASGVYEHIVANTEGCNDTLRLNLTINNGSLTQVTETTCETFTWTAGDGLTYTASGVYDHIVVNTEGCNDTLRLNLTINPNPLISLDPIQPDCDIPTGAIIVTTETTNLVFSINGSEFASYPSMGFTGLSAGDYLVEAKSSEGCMGEFKTTINPTPNAPAEPEVDFIPPTCAVATGTILITSDTSDLEFSIDGGSFVPYPVGGFSDLAPGTYTITVQNVNKCRATVDVIIPEADDLRITAIPTHVLCYGETTGAITLNIESAENPVFSWTGPEGFTATTQNIGGLRTGFYNITVTDDNGCEWKTTIQIEEPTPLVITDFNVTHVTAYGRGDGSIVLTIEGGSPIYRYEWRDAGNMVISASKDILNRGPGEYTVTIIDQNNCSISETYEIIEPAAEFSLSCPPMVTLCPGTPLPEPHTDWAAFEKAGGSASSNCPQGINYSTFRYVRVNPPVGPACNQTISRVYELYDFCGNRTECEQVFRYFDGSPPFASFYLEILVECYNPSTFNSTYPRFANVQQFLSAGGSLYDNCTATNNIKINFYEQSQLEGTKCDGKIFRYYTFTDACGNTSFPVQLTYRILDKTPPSVIYPNNFRELTVYGCELPPPYQTLNQINQASGTTIVPFDFCGGPIKFAYAGEEIINASCPLIVKRTYTFTDECNNVRTFVQTITLEDKTPPVFTEPIVPLVIDASDEQLLTKIQTWIDNVKATDNCTKVTITNNFDAANLPEDGCGELIVTFVATDECGNPKTETGIISLIKNVAVTIKADKTTVCPGTMVTITAEAENEGDNPTYRWFVDDVEQLGETGDTFTYVPDTVIVVYAILTSSEECVEQATVESNKVSIEVTDKLQVSVSITPDRNPVCVGTPVTFTAEPTNEGDNPTYRWFVDDVEQLGETGDTFTYVPDTVIVVYAILTSSEECVEQASVESNKVSIEVTDKLQVSVSITSDRNPVCVGTPVTFTAEPINEGDNPTYKWFVDDVEQLGETGDTFTYTPDTVIVVYAILTSSEECLEQATVESNKVSIEVTDKLQVSVSITPDRNPVCAGTPVTFTAEPINEGDNPTYKWFVDDVEQLGETGDTFTYLPDTVIVVYAILTSSEECLEQATVESNKVSIEVTDKLQVSVSITPDRNPVCVGTPVTFTAEPTNEGDNPTYRWFVDDVEQLGETGDTFTYVPDTVIVVYAILTSSEECLEQATVESNKVSIEVTDKLQVSVSITPDRNPVCVGTPVTFTAEPINEGDNPTYKWFVDDVEQLGETGDTFTYVPDTVIVVYAILTSSEECLEQATVESNKVSIEVTDKLQVSVSITPDRNPVCARTPVTFTAEPTNEGDNPTYKWFVDDVEQLGETGDTFTYLPDTVIVVYAILTSSEECLEQATVESNKVSIEVTDKLQVSVSITPDRNPVCVGTPVTFTAEPTNEGDNPTYKWFVDDVEQLGETGDTFTYVPDTVIVVYAILTSSEECVEQATVESNKVSIEVTDKLQVSVSITPDRNPVCARTPVTFTAEPTNEGDNPSYKWFVDDVEQLGETGDTFTYVPDTVIVVYAILTSSEECVEQATVESNKVSIEVTDKLQVSVSITPDRNPVCARTPVTFTAEPTNEGDNPTYRWFVDDVEQLGETGDTFTYVPDTVILVYAILTSSEECLEQATVESNKVSIEVTDKLQVSVSITPDRNPVCVGTPVTFTAEPTNEGDNPTYKWFVDDVEQLGETGDTFTYVPDTVILVYAILTSSEECLEQATVESNKVSIEVTDKLQVSVSITPDRNPVCVGTPVTFTAEPTNEGDNPTYKWFVDDVEQLGETGDTFTYTPDKVIVVYAILTSSEECVEQATVESNKVSITVTDKLQVSVSITPDRNPVCAGTPVTFTAEPTNEGDNPTYRWFVDDVEQLGETGDTFTYTPDKVIVVYAILTSSEECVEQATVESNKVSIEVTDKLQVSVSITPDRNPVCAGTPVTFTAEPTNEGDNPTYRWFVDDVEQLGETGDTFTYTPDKVIVVYAILTSSEECVEQATVESNKVSIEVTDKLQVSVSITPDRNPVCAGTPVTFTAEPTNEGDNPTYRWFVDDVEQSGETGDTFIYVPDKDIVVYVILTSSETCTSGNPATSNTLIISLLNIDPIAITCPG
jgi:hypothetical protein